MVRITRAVTVAFLRDSRCLISGTSLPGLDTNSAPQRNHLPVIPEPFYIQKQNRRRIRLQ